jgi:hypothetical protein
MLPLAEHVADLIAELMDEVTAPAPYAGARQGLVNLILVARR